jgi:hypothetical protein
MEFTTRTGKPMPKVIVDQAGKIGSDPVNRREFLAMASTFGATAATAYAMLGLSAPAAQAATPEMGGTVRIQQEVRALKDPRTYDWSQIANFSRWLDRVSRDLGKRRHVPALAAGKLGGQRRRHRLYAERPPGREVEQRRRLHRRGRRAQHRGLVRQVARRQLDGRPLGHADRRRHRTGARGCHRGGRQPHRPAQPAQARHHADRGHGRLPGGCHARGLRFRKRAG